MPCKRCPPYGTYEGLFGSRFCISKYLQKSGSTGKNEIHPGKRAPLRSTYRPLSVRAWVVYTCKQPCCYFSIALAKEKFSAYGTLEESSAPWTVETASLLRASVGRPYVSLTQSAAARPTGHTRVFSTAVFVSQKMLNFPSSKLLITLTASSIKLKLKISYDFLRSQAC